MVCMVYTPLYSEYRARTDCLWQSPVRNRWSRRLRVCTYHIYYRPLTPVHPRLRALSLLVCKRAHTHIYAPTHFCSADEYYAKYALSGTCTYASANVRAVLGFSPEEVVMKDMTELLPAEEAGQIWGETMDSLDGQSQLRVCHRILTNSGEYRCVPWCVR